MPATEVIAANHADVRYDPSVSGYSHPRRRRLRATEKQVADLVTSICRDNGSAGMELTDARLAQAVRDAFAAVRETRDFKRLPEDARPDLVHLAAVATLWAEAIDVPPEMAGMRPHAIRTKGRRKRKPSPVAISATTPKPWQPWTPWKGQGSPSHSVA